MVPVINATGAILHTNLGRAPLPERAARAVARAARSYTDIEVDRRTGRRGQRGDHAETLLTALTGGEGAMVVNNCAAALLLAMAALAKGRPVIVSRGELIEIGGEFRSPTSWPPRGRGSPRSERRTGRGSPTTGRRSRTRPG